MRIVQRCYTVIVEVQEGRGEILVVVLVVYFMWYTVVVMELSCGETMKIKHAQLLQ